jgi:DNA-binding MarR family transcriptional regulator
MNSDKVEFYRQMNRLVKKLRRKTISIVNRENLYPGEFRVLSVLKTEEGTSPGKIAKRWSMQPSNVTNTVNLLVKRGYAVKRRDDSDKRKMLIFITPEGEKTKDEHFKEFDEKISECLENVDEGTIGAALELINRILEQL